MLVHIDAHTEEDFVNEVLALHLNRAGYSNDSARLLGNARQRSHKGGINPWESVREDITNHLKASQDSSCPLSMVGYYWLPDYWPGREEATLRATN